MKIYRVEVMGSDTPTYADANDVAKIVRATNTGMKLVLVRNALLNPSSVKRISRAWEAEPSVLESNDEELESSIKLLT